MSVPVSVELHVTLPYVVTLDHLGVTLCDLCGSVWML